MGKQKKGDAIEIRLNAIIKLLSDLLMSQGKVTSGSVFHSLNQAGLGPTEIADLFGKSKGDIGNQIAKAKNKK